MTGPAAAFAAYVVSLLVAHRVADHWVQSTRQAVARRGLHSRAGVTGSLVCLVHVVTYTAALAGFGALAWVLLDLDLSRTGFVVSHAVSGVTYCWADRHRPLASLGSGRNRVYLQRFSTGGYALDQSLHWLWLFVAALLTVGLS